MVFALLPLGALVQAVGVVDGEHLVARLLHLEALLGCVDALKGEGGGVGVHAVSDEDACEVHGELGGAAFVDVAQVFGQRAVARVCLGRSRCGGEARGMQAVKQGLIDFHAVEAREKGVGRVALGAEFGQVVEHFVCHDGAPLGACA